jgi:hypothetical protein
MRLLRPHSSLPVEVEMPGSVRGLALLQVLVGECQDDTAMASCRASFLRMTIGESENSKMHDS